IRKMTDSKISEIR
ncbi:hypothetical protein E2320_007630, partial [Naja naja]